jgi:hypothetical protein
MALPPSTFRLVSVTQKHFTITPKDAEFNIKSEDVNFNVSFNIHWRHEEKIIMISTIIKYLSKKDNENLLSLNTENRFEILNYNEVIKDTGQSITTPDNLLNQLFAISVDTARGIIIARTENSYLSHILLGTFDPKKVLELMKKRQSENKDS